MWTVNKKELIIITYNREYMEIDNILLMAKFNTFTLYIWVEDFSEILKCSGTCSYLYVTRR